MATFGVDNFIGEVTVDGSTANYKFSDPDDVKNVQEVSISEKEFPAGTISPDSREVSDYAYSLVAEKMNAVRSDRIKAVQVKQVNDQQDAEKAEKAQTAQHMAEAQDNVTPKVTTEKREDGVVQNVYNTKPAATQGSDKKK